MVSNIRKGIYGSLIILMATITTFYIALQDSNISMKITPTTSTFYVNESGELIIAGVENVYLYNGSKKLTATLKEPLQSSQNENIITLQRRTHFNGVLIDEYYKYDITKTNVESFPISHEINVYNASGLILQYQVSKLSYNGTSRNAINPERFGHNMKVTWKEGAYYQKISKTLTGTKLTIKYKINTDYEKYNVRLFDPIILFNYVYNNIPYNETIYKTVKVNVSEPIYETKCVTNTFIENGSKWDECTTTIKGYKISEITQEVIDYNMTKYKVEKVKGTINISGSLITNANVEDNKVSKWIVPIGDRNFQEYGKCRQYEIDKRVCKESELV